LQNSSSVDSLMASEDFLLVSSKRSPVKAANKAITTRKNDFVHAI